MQTSEALRRVLACLHDPKPLSTGGYTCRCPAHSDHAPSLSVGIGEDGRVLLHCHAGCTVEAIVAAIGLEMSDLFEPSANSNGQIQIATYDYTDEDGVILFQTVRYAHPKDFRQRRPNGNGGWIPNIQGVRRVLFHLPQLNAASLEEPVFVVEGEKDVLSLEAMGLVATTNPMGAGKWRAEYCDLLRSRNVVVIPDNDDAGRLHAHTVSMQLGATAASVRLLELPGLADKGDVTDWLRAGGTREQLLGFLSTPAAKPPERIFPEPIPASKLVRGDPIRHWLWHGYLARGTTTLFSALWKAGKTTFLAHLLQRFALGGEYCGYAVQPCRVLYVTEEPESRWAERRDNLALVDNLDFLIRPFKGKPKMERWELFLDYLNELQRTRGYDLLIFDTLSNLWPVRDENDAAGVQAALMPLYTVVEDCALLMVHHTRKSDGNEATAARGSGALPAFVDTIMELRRFSPTDRKDRRRKIAGYGRYDETPEEVVVELKETEGYVSCGGDAAEINQRDLMNIITYALPFEPPGVAADELLENWPALLKPALQVLRNALVEGAKQQKWHQEGRGARGDPWRFWRTLPTTEDLNNGT